MIGVETAAAKLSARRRAGAVLALLCVAVVPAHADPVADFYRGKTVHVLVGVGAGGDYDVHARLLARYIGRHIPGQPQCHHREHDRRRRAQDGELSL